MDSRNAKAKVERSADKVADNPALRILARGGFIVTGILHILIGWIAIQIALGSDGGEEASNSGALSTIAEAPGGQVLLWVAVAGLTALGLWRLLALVVAQELKDKAKGGVLGIVYLSLAFTTATFARGDSSSDGETATDITATALSQPLGVALVALAGGVVFGVGVFNIYNGITKGFKKDLAAGVGAGNLGTAIITTGMVGYIARGIAFGILGVLIMWGALTHDPEKAAGLDAALRTLGQQPAGMVLLIAVGLGMAIYGIFCLARARYIKM